MEFLSNAGFWQAFFTIAQTAGGIAIPIVGGWILWLRGKKSQKMLQAQIETNKENIELNETSNKSLQESYTRLLEDYGFIKDLLLATRQLADNLQFESVSDKKKIADLEIKVEKQEKQHIIDTEEIASNKAEIESLRASNARKDTRIGALEKRVKELEAIRPGTGPLSVKVGIDANNKNDTQ